MAVFVIDKRKKPLMPCSEKRARQLLERGRAVAHKMRPFTIRLKDRLAEESELQPLQIKIDPGSKTTGIAVVREEEQQPENQAVLCLFELVHRGYQIKQALEQRRAFRRRRRNQLRYRPARFNNRTKPKGWLPPSLQHRVDTTAAWVERLIKLAPITGIQQELVRQKSVKGFQTGDLVKATVATGKKAGTYTGRVAIRKSGSFNIQMPDQIVQGISWKHCTLIQRGDGYGYHQISTH